MYLKLFTKSTFRTTWMLCLLFVSDLAVAKVISVKTETLPNSAQTILANHFNSPIVKTVTLNTRSNIYSVTLEDGKKLSFDTKGGLTAIDCLGNDIPLLLVPSSIRSKIARKYGYQARAIKMEKKKSLMVIDLNNGVRISINLPNEG